MILAELKNRIIYANFEESLLRNKPITDERNSFSFNGLVNILLNKPASGKLSTLALSVVVINNIGV